MLFPLNLKTKEEKNKEMKTILVTGIAGFIGSATARELENKGYKVIGIDNYNDYYDQKLKRDRTKNLLKKSKIYEGDILDKELLEKISEENKIDTIIHLAAQAGVRHSLKDPDTYIQTNIQGTNNILELARKKGIKKVIYASSSSVYGGNKKEKFSEKDRVDNPISLYAATKKANELQAAVYHNLYGINTIGLRFFTVYGPWGRPDMAAYIFTKRITEGETIKVYNYGEMERDFTYIKDIVKGIIAATEKELPGNRIYNLGNNKTEKLSEFIKIIEENLGKKAKKELLPIQPGDVPRTSADISLAKKELGYEPTTNIKEGLKEFIKWYKEYHKTK